MSSLKRWRRVGQGQFHKWEQPGEEFEGTWRGAHDGRYGPLGTLETSERLMTFPLPTALLERLRLVREGAQVLIQYTGLQTSKAGWSFKGVRGVRRCLFRIVTPIVRLGEGAGAQPVV
jgi:hypothetical protein